MLVVRSGTDFILSPVRRGYLRVDPKTALKLHECTETILVVIGALQLAQLKIMLPVTDQTSVIFGSLFFSLPANLCNRINGNE